MTDLVIFDVDGTLHDTFAWWGPVIRAGLERFAEREGIALDLPDDEAACAVVGMKDAAVWAPFLPEPHKHRWPELRRVVVPLEVEVLHSGRDYLFPGVRELLAHLRSIGVRIALASNCRGAYLEAFCEGQGLRAASDWQFCLDSDGVETKRDMLRLAVEVSGARRAVMVGDREPDLAAARELGIPFYWRVNPRCDLADADGLWHGEPNQLLTLLGLPGISWSEGR
jgi:phosphoglycolate phosphatase